MGEVSFDMAGVDIRISDTMPSALEPGPTSMPIEPTIIVWAVWHADAGRDTHRPDSVELAGHHCVHRRRRIVPLKQPLRGVGSGWSLVSRGEGN